MTLCVRVGGQRFSGSARIVTHPDEDRAARDLLVAKYRPGFGGDLSGSWKRALPVAVDLIVAGAGSGSSTSRAG